MSFKLYNTLSKQVEEFTPIDATTVRMYTCGPTVYHYVHIGNHRTYLFEDILRRALEFGGYNVMHGMNITDVGHLVGDGDDGEDKMEVGAKREGKHPLEIAKHYEEKYLEDLRELNIKPAHDILRATEAIAEQIEIIKLLEEKGFTYQDESAIYFDTSKFPNYGKLSGQKLSDKKVGVRDEVVVDSNKKNPQDFALWFFLTGRYTDHILQWPSPWGAGFPGWHIECSAISRKLLGQPFDIHAGGVDLIGTHHANEIAQSEAAFDVPLANTWMHGEFLLINEGRMGKSQGNAFTLETLKEKGFSPLDYRYLCLTAHYRSQLNFTWESLEAAKAGLQRLRNFVSKESTNGEENQKYKTDFLNALENDLDIPKALSIVWDVTKSDLSYEDKKATILAFDSVLGLELDKAPAIETKAITKNLTYVVLRPGIDPGEAPAEVINLANERQVARENKDFAKSDELRDEIARLGFEVMDTPEGQKLNKI
jgi:cysteinyl-tRNA synthetase